MCATVLIALQKHIPNSIVSQKQKHNPQRHLLDMQGEEGEEEQELGGGGGAKRNMYDIHIHSSPVYQA